METTAKEKPIIFNAAMVLAILADLKKQTRRVIKQQPDGSVNGAPYWNSLGVNVNADKYPTPKSPYGKVGDLLYVRESWSCLKEYDNIKPSEIPEGAHIQYRAGDALATFMADGKNRPSIFMPKWASRIKLLIKDVRVERVQEISEDDSLKEGVTIEERPGDTVDINGEVWHGAAKEAFKTLWESINGKRKGCDWNSNPWVWVVDFERVK